MYWEKSYKFLLFAFFALFFQTMSARVFVIPDWGKDGHERYADGSKNLVALQNQSNKFNVGSVEVVDWQNFDTLFGKLKNFVTEKVKEGVISGAGDIIKDLSLSAISHWSGEDGSFDIWELLKGNINSEQIPEEALKLIKYVPQVRITKAIELAKRAIDVQVSGEKVVFVGVEQGNHIARCATRLLANNRDFNKKKEIFSQMISFGMEWLDKIPMDKVIDVTVDLVSDKWPDAGKWMKENIGGENFDRYWDFFQEEVLKRVKDGYKLYKTLYFDSIKKLYLAACDEIEQYKIEKLSNVDLTDCLDGLITIGGREGTKFFVADTLVTKGYDHYYTDKMFKDWFLPDVNEKTFLLSVTSKDDEGDINYLPIYLAEYNIINWLFNSFKEVRKTTAHNVLVRFFADPKIEPKYFEDKVGRIEGLKRKIAKMFCGCLSGE